MPISHEIVFAKPELLPKPEINPYVGMLLDAQRDATLPIIAGDALKNMPGRWRAEFQRRGFSDSAATAPIVVEIGCHKGDLLARMAADHPNVLFVGLDITYKRVVLTATKAKDRGLNNLLAVMMNARGLNQVFARHEFQGVVIFFPDPWTKRTQQKKRLLSPDFCRLVAEWTSPGGNVWFKTDQKEYFGGTCDTFHGLGLTQTAAFKSLKNTNYISTFERKFTLAELPTYSITWEIPKSVVSGV